MLRSIIQLSLMWVKALFYGVMVLLFVLVEVYKLGFRKVFTWKAPTKPSCLDDPLLGTHGYLHLENVRIHYVASGPEDKPLMLFLHGFPDFWYSWRHQIKEFQKKYRVVAIDMRGFSESDKPKGLDAYSLKVLTTDISQVIQALGYKNCILVAHDWGGLVAWTFARYFSDMVNKLIVMNAPPIPVFFDVLSKNSAQRKMSWYIFFYQLPFLPEFLFKTNNYGLFEKIFAGCKNETGKEDLDAYKYTFSLPGAITSPMNYYRAVMQRPSKYTSHDLNYSMPVLLIWGEKDLALSSALPGAIEQLNPKISVKRIPEAGHFVHMETPIVVNEAVNAWLNEQD